MRRVDSKLEGLAISYRDQPSIRYDFYKVDFEKNKLKWSNETKGGETMGGRDSRCF